MNNPASSLYDQLGGDKGINQLTELFYRKVLQNEIIAPLFPEDIAPVQEKQYMFLCQFFGGPSLFSDAFGHPMMRARHMHVPIKDMHAEEWLRCMDAALAEMGYADELRVFVIKRLSGPAHHFVNTPDEE